MDFDQRVFAGSYLPSIWSGHAISRCLRRNPHKVCCSCPFKTSTVLRQPMERGRHRTRMKEWTIPACRWFATRLTQNLAGAPGQTVKNALSLSIPFLFWCADISRLSLIGVPVCGFISFMFQCFIHRLDRLNFRQHGVGVGEESFSGSWHGCVVTFIGTFLCLFFLSGWHHPLSLPSAY